MDTYEDLVRRFGGVPIDFGQSRLTADPGQPTGVETQPRPGTKARSYEELVASRGGRPIRFDGTETGQAPGGGNGTQDARLGTIRPGPGPYPGPDQRGLETARGPGYGAREPAGPPRPSSDVIISNLQRQIEEKSVGLTPAEAQIGSPRTKELDDLRQVLSTVASEAREKGERPGLLQQALRTLMPLGFGGMGLAPIGYRPPETE